MKGKETASGKQWKLLWQMEAGPRQPEGTRKVIPPRVLIAALCVLGLWGISGRLSLSERFQGLAM